MSTESGRRSGVRRSGYPGSMVDTERAGPDDGPERTEDEDLPGDGSVTPLSSTGDVDALRTPEPDGQDGAAPLPLETPLE